MHLNALKPAPGSKKAAKRVGRGIGCGNGKTCGRGHKGQSSRSGYSSKQGFEGGQMPLQRRMPKFGFTSKKSMYTAEVPLHALKHVKAKIIDLAALKAADLVQNNITDAKIMLSGELDKAVTLSGLKVTKGAKAAIEAKGGKVE